MWRTVLFLLGLDFTERVIIKSGEDKIYDGPVEGAFYQDLIRDSRLYSYKYNSYAKAHFIGVQQEG